MPGTPAHPPLHPPCRAAHPRVNWLRLFPDADFRFQMGLRPGNAPAFFGGPQDSAILAQRSRIIQRHPADCLLESRTSAEHDTLSLLSSFTGKPLTTLPDAAAACEADFVILTPDAAGIPTVSGGVVCFPSSWSLRDKAGLPMSAVHAPVPGLNADMGRGIDTFLSRLGSDAVWERDNWGLSADGELDHHPRHRRAPLTACAALDSTWLRLERQILLRPASDAILFGIHVSVHRLDTLARVPGLAPRIARALETMPPEIAAYKGLTAARTALAHSVRSISAPAPD